jgi:hypothetical protein
VTQSQTTERGCSVAECRRAFYCRDVCKLHYDRQRRGNIDAVRFWSEVDTSGGPDACWPWTGGTRKGGYGVTTEGLGAHKAAYLLAVGPVPAGCDVCHSCDNPPCCNPAHLWTGTRQQNLLDMVLKGRGRVYKGRPWHKLRPGDATEIRRRVQEGESRKSVAAAYGIDPSYISYLVRGRRWPEVFA